MTRIKILTMISVLLCSTTILAQQAPKQPKKVVKPPQSSCILEDRLHPKTGEVLGKRWRCDTSF